MFSIIAIQDQTGDPAHDLTTVEEVLAELGIAGDADTNAEIADQISLYSKIIATYCDRIFAKEYITETFVLDRGECLSWLPLSRYPVDTIYSVTVDGVELDESNWIVNPENGLLNHLIRGHWYGWRVVVTYVGGYDLPGDAPTALNRACVEFIKDRRPAGDSGSSVPVSSVRAIEDSGSRVEFFQSNAATGTTTNAAIPSSVADLISPFRKISVC